MPAAVAGKGVSKFLKRFRLEEHFLITCGASAGLAAAFNAPMAGVMFALEEVHKNFSAIVMLSCMSSALVADYIANGLFGMEPVFSFAVQDMIPLHDYPMIIGLGLLCGVLGVLYNKVLLASQTAYGKLDKLPDWGRLAIPFVLAGVLGLAEIVIHFCQFPPPNPVSLIVTSSESLPVPLITARALPSSKGPLSLCPIEIITQSPGRKALRISGHSLL